MGDGGGRTHTGRQRREGGRGRGKPLNAQRTSAPLTPGARLRDLGGWEPTIGGNGERPGQEGPWGGGGQPPVADLPVDKAQLFLWERAPRALPSWRGGGGGAHPCDMHQGPSLPQPHPPFPRDLIFTLVKCKDTKPIYRGWKFPEGPHCSARKSRATQHPPPCSLCPRGTGGGQFLTVGEPAWPYTPVPTSSLAWGRWRPSTPSQLQETKQS